MKRIAFALIIFLSFFSGSKKEILQEVKNKGVVLSYANSKGLVLVYKSKSENIIEYYEKDITYATRSSVTRLDTFMVNTVDENGNIKLSVRFGPVSATVMEGNEIKPTEEGKELEGEKLELYLDRDGKIIDWSGLESIGFNEAGIDQGEMIANTYATFGVLHFPPDTLKIGSSWKKIFPTKLSTKKGAIEQNIEKNYLLKGFEIKDNHLCAKIATEIKVEVSGEGTIENEKYYTKGTGNGKGEILFDIEGGYLYKSSTSWILDFEIKTESGQKATYSQETKESWNLVEK